MSATSIFEKRNFLKWFIGSHQFKDRDAAVFLRFLITRGDVLSRVHFSDHPVGFLRCAVIATSDMAFAPFEYHRKGKSGRIVNLAEAIQDIMTHTEDRLGVTLLFKDQATCPQFLAINEEDRSMPYPHIEIIQQLEAEDLADQLTLTYTRRLLMDAIDAALDTGNKEEFERASVALSEFDQTGGKTICRSTITQ